MLDNNRHKGHKPRSFTVSLVATRRVYMTSDHVFSVVFIRRILVPKTPSLHEERMHVVESLNRE